MKKLRKFLSIAFSATGILIILVALAVGLFANNALDVAIESGGTKARESRRLARRGHMWLENGGLGLLLRGNCPSLSTGVRGCPPSSCESDPKSSVPVFRIACFGVEKSGRAFTA